MSKRSFARGAVVRDPAEEHRAATPLELFFDLCFVVAVAQTATGLHHELVEGHPAEGIIRFIVVFITVWWGWMNFTWFADAHDADDVPYRLLTLVQIAGALVMAAGVPRVFAAADLTVITMGYVLMRSAQVTQWVRVGLAHPALRRRALRYAAGIGALQVLWLLRLLLPEELAFASWAVLILAEMLVPVWAERSGPTGLFHAEHLAERYGLFTLIVLGESVLAATVSLERAANEVGLSADFVAVAASALVIAFAAWWLYFGRGEDRGPRSAAVVFRWGYGHLVVFAALAALGAGSQVVADWLAGSVPPRMAALSVAVPVAAYLLGLASLELLAGAPGPPLPALGAGAAAAVILGYLAPPLFTMVGLGLILSLVVVVAERFTPGPSREGHASPGAADSPDPSAR